MGGMGHSSREVQLRQKLLRVIPGVTPGLVLSVFHGGRRKMSLEVGQTHTYYDWASLTKVVLTTTALMDSLAQKSFHLDDRLDRHLSWAPSGVTVRTLLNHTAGFEWWRPYFKSMPMHSSVQEGWFEIQRQLSKEIPNRRRARAVYSDLDFLYLGFLLERLHEKPFLNLAQELFEKLGMHDTHLNANNRPRFSRQRYAPTHRCSWRGKLLQGEVDDENAWSMGGVAPHAGVFGPMRDLETWALQIRKAALGEKGVLEPRVVRSFLRRSLDRRVGDWALGFMMPTPGVSSCGPRFSLGSVGHTGFTGTSVWWDPKVDLLVLILSNRVHPNRDNNRFKDLRPQIHTWIYDSVVRESS